MTQRIKHVVGLYLALACLVASLPGASCDRAPHQPGPVPVAPHDAAPEWINPWADAGDAFERCVQAKIDDPVVQNVSLQSRTPITALADRICADPLIVEQYANDR